MNLPIKNGLYAPNIQPVKTQQKKNCKPNFMTPSYACLQRDAKAIEEQLTFLPRCPTDELPHRFIGVYFLPSRFIKDAFLQIRGQA